MSIVVEAALIGIAVGIVIGSLGGGGGIVAVPVLVYLLGQSPHDAAASSLVVVGTSSLVSLVPHARRGHVDWRMGSLFAVASIAGNLAGARASALVPGDLLMAGFAVLLGAVAVLMIRRARSGFRATRGDGATRDNGAARHRRSDGDTRGDGAVETDAVAAGSGLTEESPPAATTHPGSGSTTAQPVQPTQPALPSRPWAPRRVALVLATATGVGALTGFFGVGGGFAVVPALVVALGLPMRSAVGTSLLVLVGSSVVGLAGRAGTGLDPDWGLTLAFAATSIVGALVGERVTRSVRPEALTAAFAALVAGVALVTAALALPTLLG